VMRSFADASQLKVEVHSGSHYQKDLPLASGPLETITYILLTPGYNCSLHDFASALDWPPFSSSDPGYVNDRLQALQLSPDRDVRDSACLASARMFWYRPTCLVQVLDNPDANMRRGANELKHDNANLPGMLRTAPFPLFPRSWNDHMVRWFEVYTQDMRPEVRKAACAHMRQLIPDLEFPSCRGSE
jgi:hypothetical protein